MTALVTQIPKGGAGLGGAYAEYQLEANGVIYNQYASTSDLDQELMRLKTKYDRHAGARNVF